MLYTPREYTTSFVAIYNMNNSYAETKMYRVSNRDLHTAISITVITEMI